MHTLLYLLIVLFLAWFIMVYLAIKRRLSSRIKCFLVVLTIWIGMLSYWLLGYYFYEPKTYPNSHIIEQYCQQYEYRKTVYHSLASCLTDADVQEEVSFARLVNNSDGYSCPVQFIDLIKMPCFRRNADMISNYFDNIGCYKDLVWFARGDRNLNNKNCTLEKMLRINSMIDLM